MRLDEVNAYLEAIGASTAEWEACIMTVAGTHGSWVTKDQASQVEYADETKGFQKMREWVSEHAPGMLEAATLRALEEMAREGDLSVARELALKFHAAGGNDAYLCRVLDEANDLTDAEDVRVMIEQLSDSALQAEYREKLSSIFKKE
ncbi:MAG: hypothetical protein EOP83_02685 [Verrucomicrobiaceae bacterium]|nr:MAG: hypothetical protein EOP83_02685 [Verrucomicrobiaceae bacterium]